MVIPHPIPYQGSKRNLATAILEYFPNDVKRLIEPFAGSAAISLAAAYKKKAQSFHLNDINKPLMRLWEDIINTPESLSDKYEQLWRNQLANKKDFYYWARNEFNATNRSDYFLYLLARCVKASVRYNANGEFNQSPDNRRKGRKPQSMRQDICAASNLLRNKVTLTSLDYKQVIADAAGEDLIYLDPPYQGVCVTRDPRYIVGINYDMFAQSLDELNSMGISYIVSYDGRTGNKTFGKPLPDFLNLLCVELDAGRSSQATLLGRNDKTYESLYLSPALVKRISLQTITRTSKPQQLSLFSSL